MGYGGYNSSEQDSLDIEAEIRKQRILEICESESEAPLPLMVALPNPNKVPNIAPLFDPDWVRNPVPGFRTIPKTGGRQEQELLKELKRAQESEEWVKRQQVVVSDDSAAREQAREAERQQVLKAQEAEAYFRALQDKNAMPHGTIPSGEEAIQRIQQRAIQNLWKNAPLPHGILTPEEQMRRAEIISKHKQIVPTGVKIWGGKELDAGTSEMSRDDAFATMTWLDLYLRTPTEFGGTTQGSEKANVERWLSIATRRNFDLATAGVTKSPLWAALKGMVSRTYETANYHPGFKAFTKLMTAGVEFWWGIPQAIEDAQERMAQRTKFFQQGGFGKLAAPAAFILALGDFLAFNKWAMAFSGKDLTTDKEYTWGERFGPHGLADQALTETVMLLAGAKSVRVKNPVFRTGQTAEGMVLSPIAKPAPKPIFTAEQEAAATEAIKTRFIWSPETESVAGEATFRMPIGMEVPLRPMRPPTPYVPRVVTPVPKGPYKPGFQWVYENGAWIEKRLPPRTEFQYSGSPFTTGETPTGWRILPADEAAYYFRIHPRSVARSYDGMTIVPIEGAVSVTPIPVVPKPVEVSPWRRHEDAGVWDYEAVWGHPKVKGPVVPWVPSMPSGTTAQPVPGGFQLGPKPVMPPKRVMTPVPSVPFRPEVRGMKFKPHSDGTYEVIFDAPPPPQPTVNFWMTTTEEAALTAAEAAAEAAAKPIILTAAEKAALDAILIPMPGKLPLGPPKPNPWRPPFPHGYGYMRGVHVLSGRKQQIAQQIRDDWSMLSFPELTPGERRLIVEEVVTQLREYVRL